MTTNESKRQNTFPNGNKMREMGWIFPSGNRESKRFRSLLPNEAQAGLRVHTDGWEGMRRRVPGGQRV